MADWSETKSILLEIEQIFLRDDDLNDINDINKMMSEIENERNGHLTDFRELLRRRLLLLILLTLSLSLPLSVSVCLSVSLYVAVFCISSLEYSMKVKQKEEEVLAPSMVSSFFSPPSAARSSPQASHQKNIEKMNVEKENLILSANKTSELIAAELEAISKLAESSIQIQQNTSPSLEDPHLESRTSYALSLYGRISNISWDYTAPSGRLAGCESPPPPSSLLSHGSC
jgi:hypothetical protein